MPSLERDVSEERSLEENEEDGRNKEEVSDPPSYDADSVINDKEKDQYSEEDSSSVKKCDEDIDEETEEGANENEADLPIDKGWAWVVLAGSWLNIALMMGYLRGLSVLFVEYLRVFNASAAKTTLLMGVTAAVASLSALISMNILVGKLGLRKTTLLGAVLSVTGLACAIAPINIDFIIGTHSILLGMGNAMVFGPCLVQVGLYFNKRRGFASTVAMSGVSLGGMVFPPMIRYFLDEYGLQGTMILLTGINMNMFVGASVFWPLESFKKRKSNATQEELPQNNKYEDKSGDNLHKCPSTQTTSKASPMKPCSDIRSESPLLPHRRLRTESTGSKLSRTSNNVWFYASQSEFGSVMSIPKEHIQPDINQKRTSCQCLRNVFSSLDFSLFKRPMFIFVVCYSFFSVTCYLSGAYLPALASEKGISKQDAALFLTVMGALDFICRLPLGVLLDKKIIRVNTLMAIGLMVNGAGSLFTYFYNSYPTVFMFACINGISTCTYFGVIPIGIIEFMGIDYLAKTLGFVTLFHGLSEAIANPLMGGIRDATGSYVGAYLYLGVTTYIGAILLLCEPLARSYSKRNNKTILDLDVESKPLKNC